MIECKISVKMQMKMLILTPCSGNNLCVDLGSGVPKQTIDIFNRSASLAQSI